MVQEARGIPRIFQWVDDHMPIYTPRGLANHIGRRSPQGEGIELQVTYVDIGVQRPIVAGRYGLLGIVDTVNEVEVSIAHHVPDRTDITLRRAVVYSSSLQGNSAESPSREIAMAKATSLANRVAEKLRRPVSLVEVQSTS